ncbi:PP2C family protein-serine/threonine phosphatase [Rheinheimera sp.]|uniref:PP2C family protein-serine/threonine phosphatase n=1 Tax=Rheinheimera sp. TaxID=1869214 RepID=UPI0027326F40|nr:SpoIIE family protein phosphatase [Rheinheimera sp.]MDP2715768.1 SpoIIE family protein phosphatase [Rheinheimera sp.]
MAHFTSQPNTGADDSVMVFAADVEVADEPQASWTVLIVDDDVEIHQITKLALRDFNFQQHKLNFISAYSAAEARDILAAQHDIALILLDVVMETDDAGLTLVRYIRETLHNDLVRIILRTGQPGQAPEQRVVQDYDINDYRAKTELTVQRLNTSVVSALRSYVAIEQLAQLNASLEQQVQARTAELQQSNQQLQHTLAELEAGERAGKQVQFKMLPPADFNVAQFQFSHALYPSEFMSGDFVDYFAADEHKVVFYIADVSGHGVASAFVTVYLKRFISANLERYRRGSSAMLTDPAALLAALNSELLLEKIGKYIALFYAVLDTQSGEITYANAGAFPWPLLLQGQDSGYLSLKSTPVGMFDFAGYANQSMQLQPDSSLLLFSDGMLDLLPQQSTEQKLQHLLHVSRQHSDIAALLLALDIDPTAPLPDDLTILKLSRH